MKCPKCGKAMEWIQVTCEPSKTVRVFACSCGAKESKTEPPKPPEFFQIGG